MILSFLFILISSSIVFSAENSLEGTYKLISSTRKILDTGEVINTYGENPTGYIMYGEDGRMLGLIVRNERPKAKKIENLTQEQKAALFSSMLAYGGTYKFDGKSVQHNIDISWNEIWTGITVIREIRKEGDKLIYTTLPAPFSGDGKMSITTLVWEKVR